MTSELEELLQRSDALGDRLGDEEAVEVNAAILDLHPGYPKITKRLGIGLLKNQRPAGAVAVLEAGLRHSPEDPIMLKRLAEAERRVERPTGRGAAHSSRKRSRAESAGWADFETDELIETALAGPGRDACVRLCAASIRASESIDRERSAVTPVKPDRFRVSGISI